MKTKYLLFLGLGLLRINLVSAQLFQHHYSFDLIKSQPLVVLLPEEDPKELRKLANKPEELADYKAYVAYYSKQMRVLAPRYWKYSPTVEFRPESALKEIRAAQGQRTVVLRYETHVNGASTTGYHSTYKGSRQVAYMELTTPGSGDQNLEADSPAPLDIMYPSDMVFALRTIQRQLETEEKRAAKAATGRSRQDILQEERALNAAVDKADAELIRSRTLLIAEGDLDPKLTAEGIRQFYPYPYQVVPRATIEAAVQAGDTRYTYARRLCQSVEVIGPFLIDAATSRTLAIANTGGVDAGSKELIDKEVFKIYAAYVKRHLEEK
ncbi:MAG: hypothetical protein EOO57_10855 [Hymenobacter sp.]|nr:MAG: hypothetical protein EOO57_10855 [Hymenobacter sp.]